jgi:2-dehydro-3-deoxygluconokinase
LGDLPSCRRGDSVNTSAAPAAVVTLGETMASFVAREQGPMAETADFRRTIAGAEANVAAGDGALERRSHDGQVVTTWDDGFPVGSARDPIGAGDAFTAGYIAASLEGQPVAQVLRAASACGAAAVASLGDQTGLLTRSELDRLLGGRSGDTLR